MQVKFGFCFDKDIVFMGIFCKIVVVIINKTWITVDVDVVV